MTKECCTPDKEPQSSCCEPDTPTCCGGNTKPPHDKKTLNIHWKRLVKDEETCPRCGSTEEELTKAVKTLEKYLTPLGFRINLEKSELTVDEFKKAPLQSNTITINNQLLKTILNAETGQSPCCDVCGPTDCRTITIDDQTYETIPEELIIKAALTTATKMMTTLSSCC